MELKFRNLREDEIDCRIARIAKDDSGLQLLLYKDARVDMNILDETVGPMNWQRHHSRDNANCTVAIFDDLRGQWIEKEDTGTESYTEAEKGLASDSFKRACFNWGIGRELYTSPFIWIKGDQCNIRDGKCYDRFYVVKITTTDGRITQLVIANASKGNKVVYTCGLTQSDEDEVAAKKMARRKELVQLAAKAGVKTEVILAQGKVTDLGDLPDVNYEKVKAMLEAKINGDGSDQ